MQYLVTMHGVSRRRACKVIGIHRSTERRQSYREIAALELKERIITLSERFPRFGYRKIFDRLKTEGIRIGRERVRLLRKQEGLSVVKKQKRKRRLHGKKWELQAQYPNHVWSYDFVEDATADGRRLRFLTVIDEFTRECRAIVCARSQSAAKVKQVLQQLIAYHGAPQFVRSDNGPELIARELRNWLKKKNITTAYIEPGSPWQNAYIESFNGIFRDSCLNRWLFFTTAEAKQIAEQWREEYNHERPHGSLGGRTPSAYAEEYRISRNQEAA